MSREVKMVLDTEILCLEKALKEAGNGSVVTVKSVKLPRERVEQMIRHLRPENSSSQIDPTVIPLSLLAVSPEWRKIQLWLNSKEEMAMTR